MSQEVLFAKTLDQVKQNAKENGNMITEESVKEAFAPLNLGVDQMQLVFDYLSKHQIGIGETIEQEMELSEEDIHYLDIYLEELKDMKAVTSDETQAITLSAMAGDLDAKMRLIEIYLPQVVEIAKLYTGQGAFLEDLIGEGNVALTMGMELLGCVESHTEVQGMLGKMMMDAMEHYIEEIVQLQEADKAIVEKVNQIAEASKEVAEELLGKVSVEELAKETKFTEEEIREAIRISGGSMEYIEEK